MQSWLVAKCEVRNKWAVREGRCGRHRWNYLVINLCKPAWNCVKPVKIWPLQPKTTVKWPVLYRTRHLASLLQYGSWWDWHHIWPFLYGRMPIQYGGQPYEGPLLSSVSCRTLWLKFWWVSHRQPCASNAIYRNAFFNLRRRVGSEREKCLHFTKLGKSNKVTTTYNIAHHNITWLVWIYHPALIKQLYHNFLGVNDNYQLASRIEVDKITWPGLAQKQKRGLQAKNWPYCFCHFKYLSHCPAVVIFRKCPMIG